MSAVVASLIVACNPHDNDLAVVLAGYAHQAAMSAGFELIVVDNGSRVAVAGACADLARAAPDVAVRHVTSDRPGRAAANNAGVRAAHSDLLIFVADDFIPTPLLVRAHVDFHAHLAGPCVGIGPAQFTPACRALPFCRWLEESGRLFGVPFRTAIRHWPREFFYVGNASMSRALFERIGGFDEAFVHDALDDLDFGIRLRGAGFGTHLLPKALAWHDHEVTPAERTLAMHRAGVAAARYEQRKPGVRPWAAIVDQPLPALLRVVDATKDARQGRAQDEHFNASMDLAFLRGYHGLWSEEGSPAIRGDAGRD